MTDDQSAAPKPRRDREQMFCIRKEYGRVALVFPEVTDVELDEHVRRVIEALKLAGLEVW